MSDLTKCPKCGGYADNGHDRCYPPTVYYCTKCEDGMTTKPDYSAALKEAIACAEHESADDAPFWQAAISALKATIAIEAEEKAAALECASCEGTGWKYHDYQPRTVCVDCNGTGLAAHKADIGGEE